MESKNNEIMKGYQNIANLQAMLKAVKKKNF